MTIIDSTPLLRFSIQNAGNINKMPVLRWIVTFCLHRILEKISIRIWNACIQNIEIIYFNNLYVSKPIGLPTVCSESTEVLHCFSNYLTWFILETNRANAFIWPWTVYFATVIWAFLIYQNSRSSYYIKPIISIGANIIIFLPYYALPIVYF